LEKNYLFKRFLIENQEKLKSRVSRDEDEDQEDPKETPIVEEPETELDPAEDPDCDSIKEELNEKTASDQKILNSPETAKKEDLKDPPKHPSPSPPEPKKKPTTRKRLASPIPCPSCDKKFHYKSYLNFHYSDVHLQKNEICPTCGKQFKNSRRLNSHLAIHSQVKKYRCEVDGCQKQFNFSSDLQRHLRIHRNIRPYQCDLCQRSFVQSYALTLHKQNKHEHLRYRCEKCDAEFSCKPTLKKHLFKCVSGNLKPRVIGDPQNKKRSKYVCTVDGCDRQYAMKKYLKNHLVKDHQTSVMIFFFIN
jgi:uncharacterized Zn-finger protein